MRSWTAVIDVSENMQLVDGESLDDVCDGNDKGISPSRVDDRINDDVDVCGLVRILRAFMEQFLNDIREVFGQRFAHLAACVFAGDITADGYEMVDCDMIPVVEVFFRSLDEFQFLFGVINECAEFSLLCLSQCRAKEFADLAFDVARSVFQHVLKSFIFSVKVCQEMLSTFWQIKDSL